MVACPPTPQEARRTPGQNRKHATNEEVGAAFMGNTAWRRCGIRRGVPLIRGEDQPVHDGARTPIGMCPHGTVCACHLVSACCSAADRPTTLDGSLHRWYGFKIVERDRHARSTLQTHRHGGADGRGQTGMGARGAHSRFLPAGDAQRLKRSSAIASATSPVGRSSLRARSNTSIRLSWMPSMCLSSALRSKPMRS